MKATAELFFEAEFVAQSEDGKLLSTNYKKNFTDYTKEKHHFFESNERNK